MKVYGTKEVAEMLKINKRTVLNEINRGNLKAKKIGNKYRITEKAIQEYMNIKGGDDD